MEAWDLERQGLAYSKEKFPGGEIPQHVFWANYTEVCSDYSGVSSPTGPRRASNQVIAPHSLFDF
jgi:hypothetical protein